MTILCGVVERPTSPIMMNRYVTLQALGDGTYGSVVLGQRVDTGEKVGANSPVNHSVKRFRVISPTTKRAHAMYSTVQGDPSPRYSVALNLGFPLAYLALQLQLQSQAS